MKLELMGKVTISQDELNQAVLCWLKTLGKGVPDETELTVIISRAIPIPVSHELQDVKNVIGQEIDGAKITHYGYPGDSSPDSGSMSGRGDRSGYQLRATVSVALTQSERQARFGVSHPSTGKSFEIEHGGVKYTFVDEDSAPEVDRRIDVYDPFYGGRDTGCTDEMYAKSLAEMRKAGILT